MIFSLLRKTVLPFMAIIFKIHRTWINKRYITASRCPMYRWSIFAARSTRLTAWNASCLLPLLLNVKQHLYLSAKPNKWKSCEDIDKATNTFINATLELESAIQQYQRAEAKLGGAVTTIGKKGRYHQSAHRQSYGECSHKIKGVCKCQ